MGKDTLESSKQKGGTTWWLIRVEFMWGSWSMSDSEPDIRQGIVNFFQKLELVKQIEWV